MKKLTLDLENLVVESFDTTVRRRDGAGTVRGHIDEFNEQQVAVAQDRTFDVSCYCETNNCVTRITCYSCYSCRTCNICFPLTVGETS